MLFYENNNYGRLLLLNEQSYRPWLRLILKSCVCSLKWAQVELNCLICLEDRSFRSNLLLMQKVDYGLYQQPILTWSCIKIRSAKHLNSFWTLIVNPNNVQNRRKNQSFLNFNPTSRYDTCACPPVRNDVVTPRHLFTDALYFHRKSHRSDGGSVSFPVDSPPALPSGPSQLMFLPCSND